MPERTNTAWLKEENIPQLSDDLKKRLEKACQHRGVTPEIIREVDAAIKRACMAIGKHYGRDTPVCPRCDKLVPANRYMESYYCGRCLEWFPADLCYEIGRNGVKISQNKA